MLEKIQSFDAVAKLFSPCAPGRRIYLTNHFMSHHFQIKSSRNFLSLVIYKSSRNKKKLVLTTRVLIWSAP